MKLSRVTAPAAEPVSLEEFKLHSRIDGDTEDNYLSGLLTAAREHVEDLCARSLVTQEWELALDAFPPEIRLPMAPVQGVASVTYLDPYGISEQLPAWSADLRAAPARLLPAYGEAWPATRASPNAVVVAYTAGYGDPADVPQRLRHAILLLAAHWYEHREATDRGLGQLPFGVEALCAPFRAEWMR